MSDPNRPRLASLTSTDLLLSLLIPIGSDVQVEPDFLRVLLPGDAARRATFTVRSEMPPEPGEAWFTAFREEAVSRMPESIPGFELLGREDFVLSSFTDVTAVSYRRELPDGDQVAQLQAYLWATSYRMYVIDAATAWDRRETHLPLFLEILRSIRLLPPR